MGTLGQMESIRDWLLRSFPNQSSTHPRRCRSAIPGFARTRVPNLNCWDCDAFAHKKVLLLALKRFLRSADDIIYLICCF